MLKKLSAIFMLACGGLLFQGSWVLAQEEEGHRSLLISKLEKVHQNLAPKDSSKVAVTLRLADLYAERARLESMKEFKDGCTNCEAGRADRKKALRLYTEVLDRAPEAVQGKVMIQVGHLYQLTGDEEKALGFYQKILQEMASSDIKAEAQLSLGEIYFKRRDFAKAQGFYQEVLKNTVAPSRGYAAYRSAWCAFHRGDLASALQQMEQILKTPALLTRKGSIQTSADPQFYEEVSRDYTTFLSQKNIEVQDIENLFKLSPDSLRVENVKSLALEAERLGKTAEALRVWNFVLGHMSRPEDRLTAKVAMAQLSFHLNNKEDAFESFESAMQLWKDLKTCERNGCEELRRRARQLVVSWHQTEKKEPSVELLSAYQAFLSQFPEDGDMNVYAATVAKNRQNWSVAWTYYNKAREIQSPSASADPAMADKLELTLIALLDLAENSKNESYQSQAYDLYLDQSLKKSKAFEVRYQKAHGLYEKENYGPAAVALRELALDKKGDEKIRRQAANLSLDALVLLKDETQLPLWASEYAKVFTGDTKDFTEIVQKAILTRSARLAEKDALAAYTELVQLNPSQASQEDRTKYYKNKLILAEKLHKFTEAQSAADSMLQQPGLVEEDREFAWSRKAVMAEMTLDFAGAFTATEKLRKSLKADEKVLKMAMLAELSGQKSAPYYGQYLQLSQDEENKKWVAAELVRKSKTPEKEIEVHRGLFRKSPVLLAQLYAESYAKTSHEGLLKKVTHDPVLKSTEPGKLLSRMIFLKEFNTFKKPLAAQKLETKTDRKLAASIKARVTSLEKLEAFTKRAIEMGDWTSQLVSLDLLAKESERFYNELLSAPLPSGLSDEEQQQYLQLLSKQATPFQEKSLSARTKSEEFWKSSKWISSLKTSWEQVELRGLMITEVQALREIAPPEFQASLAEFVMTSQASSAASLRPSLQEVQKARNLVNQNPFNKKALQALLDLEKRSENTAMSQYLQTRIENLSKASADSTDSSIEKGVL